MKAVVWVVVLGVVFLASAAALAYWGGIFDGPTVRQICEYDCVQSQSCAKGQGYLPVNSLPECVQSCTEWGMEHRAVVEKHYGQCAGLINCDWFNCINGNPPVMRKHFNELDELRRSR